MQLTFSSVGLVLRLVPPPLIYSSALIDCDTSFLLLYPHSLLHFQFFVWVLVWWRAAFPPGDCVPAEGLGGSDTLVCQPRSRVAVGCHNWGCSCPEHEVRSLCLCHSSRSCAKSRAQPHFPGPFLPSKGCGRSAAVPSQVHWDAGRCPRYLLLLNLLSCWYKLFRRDTGVPAAASCWVSVFLSCFLFVIRCDVLQWVKR